MKASKLNDKLERWDNNPEITLPGTDYVGFYRGMLHLAWGKSYAGKTSLCIYTAKKALEQGLDVLYWDTEAGVKNHSKNTEHLEALVEAQEKGGSELIMSEEVPGEDQFIEKIDELEEMIEKHRPDVLVIDSILFPVIDLQSNKRASRFRTVFKKLSRITSQHDLITLVTTHVSTTTESLQFDKEGGGTMEVDRPIGGNSMLHTSDIKLYVEDLQDPNQQTDDRERRVHNVDDQVQSLVKLVPGKEVMVCPTGDNQ